MKPIALLFLCGALALVAGSAASLWLAGRPEAPLAEAAAPVPAPADRASEEALRRDLASLQDRVAEMQAEIAILRARDSRIEVPAAETLAEAQEEAAGAPVDETLRRQIVQVLEQQRETERKQREQERLQREQEQILARAERIARELSLPPADEKKLADFMTAASAKRDDLFAGARDGSFDRIDAMSRFQELRDWSTRELERSFGSDLAQQIAALDRGGRGLGLGFGGPGGFGGGRGAQRAQAAGSGQEPQGGQN